MAIEKTEQRRGKDPITSTVPVGHGEQLSPRGFWRKAKYFLFDDVDREKSSIKVLSDDQIEISHTTLVGAIFSLGRAEKRSEILAGEDINDKNIKTDRMGLPPKVVSFTWKPSSEQDPTKTPSQK